MAIAYPSNLEYLGDKPNFTRDTFDTRAEMEEALSSGYIDEGHISYCKETRVTYRASRGSGGSLVWTDDLGDLRGYVDEVVLGDEKVISEAIFNINQRTESIEATLPDLASRIGAVETGNITGLVDRVTAAESGITGNAADITGLTGRIGTLETKSLYADAAGTSDIKVDQGRKLWLADRESTEGSLGYVILRNKEQLTGKVSTIFEVRSAFDFGGSTVSIGDGCHIKFIGGSFTNVTLDLGNHVKIYGTGSITQGTAETGTLIATGRTGIEISGVTLNVAAPTGGLSGIRFRECSGVRIDSVKFVGPGDTIQEGTGIYLYKPDTTVITGCSFEGFKHKYTIEDPKAIKLVSPTETDVIGCSMTGTYIGIEVLGLITNLTITDNSFVDSIRASIECTDVYSVSGLVITGNTFDNPKDRDPWEGFGILLGVGTNEGVSNFKDLYGYYHPGLKTYKRILISRNNISSQVGVCIWNNTIEAIGALVSDNTIHDPNHTTSAPAVIEGAITVEPVFGSTGIYYFTGNGVGILVMLSGTGLEIVGNMVITSKTGVRVVDSSGLDIKRNIINASAGAIMFGSNTMSTSGTVSGAVGGLTPIRYSPLWGFNEYIGVLENTLTSKSTVISGGDLGSPARSRFLRNNITTTHGSPAGAVSGVDKSNIYKGNLITGELVSRRMIDWDWEDLVTVGSTSERRSPTVTGTKYYNTDLRAYQELTTAGTPTQYEFKFSAIPTKVGKFTISWATEYVPGRDYRMCEYTFNIDSIPFDTYDLAKIMVDQFRDHPESDWYLEVIYDSFQLDYLFYIKSKKNYYLTFPATPSGGFITIRDAGSIAFGSKNPGTEDTWTTLPLETSSSLFSTTENYTIRALQGDGTEVYLSTDQLKLILSIPIEVVDPEPEPVPDEPEPIEPEPEDPDPEPIPEEVTEEPVEPEP